MKEQPGAALVAGNRTRDGPRLGLHVDTRVTANLQDQLEMVTEPGQEEKTQWRVPCPNTVIQSGFPYYQGKTSTW